ncbi:LacI family transcriptional regulator, purine nucleotide synthesis repressor [Butyrivibrio fibrisolvens DSM 3071]|uniref:LacI family transcriptional regulator, purine nucleotide synthesis repressor n=1 Tax=Butyrivibrio fibrisolvens DSM 3071 TaxID=1121131 RepID=A0A1M6D973_BUTFI|nr:LacI family DNA-binding transcriptional regulator [Butyrivibrio fibrisolvens]SHI69680.1 LacI family transcriptional regulator, purine nucleotide synthesis repressor [Butyrivibrio fibrisolvens DSM 3071]
MVSIKDVAKEAGVAISTVSKVLNNYPNVSEDTKLRVMEVVKRLGFVPNTVAATLSSKNSGRVALLIKLNVETQAIDEIDMQYISGAISKARELQLDVITIFFSMVENMTLDEMTRYFVSQSIKGIIIYGMSKEDKVLRQLIENDTFKTVVIDVPYIGATTSCVSVNQAKAQYDVAKKTIKENNCRKVLYIAGTRDGYVTDARLEGIKQLKEELGLQVLIRNGNFSELQARNITLKYGKNKDCVVCASDLMAIGAMKALIDMDIFRPVCGFDGIVLMGYVGKQMNTVRQNFAAISSRAVEEMQKLLDGEEGIRVTMPHELVRLKYEEIIR